MSCSTRQPYCPYISNDLPFMQNHQNMIETKRGGERRRAGLITPINGSSYCISKTHLRVEVNTFIMVVIMARKAHLQ